MLRACNEAQVLACLSSLVMDTMSAADFLRSTEKCESSVRLSRRSSSLVCCCRLGAAGSDLGGKERKERWAQEVKWIIICRH